MNKLLWLLLLLPSFSSAWAQGTPSGPVTWQQVPNCPDTGGQHLNTSSPNKQPLLCGSTSSGGGGGGAGTITTINGATGQISTDIPGGPIVTISLANPITVPLGFSANISAPPQLICSGATCTANATASNNWEADLTNNSTTMTNPSGTLTYGTSGVIYFRQDVTGGRNVTSWGSNFFGTGGVSINTAPGAVTPIAYTVSSSSGISLVSNQVGGSVTSIATNNGLTGGTIVTSGTIGLAAIANNAVLCNNSGASAVPIATNCTVSGTGSVVLATSSSLSSPTLNGTATFNGTAGLTSATTNAGTVYGTSDVQSGTTYTLLAADCGKPTFFTSNSAVTVTIPASIVPASGTTCIISVTQSGTAKISVNGTAVSAATLISADGFTGTAGIKGATVDLVLTTVGGTATAYLSGQGS